MRDISNERKERNDHADKRGQVPGFNYACFTIAEDMNKIKKFMHPLLSGSDRALNGVDYTTQPNYDVRRIPLGRHKVYKKNKPNLLGMRLQAENFDS
mgnify:CR=1 FL=1